MTGKPSLEVRDKIRGPRGSTVKLTLERAATKRIEKVDIVRDAVPQPSIPDAYMSETRCRLYRHDQGFQLHNHRRVARCDRSTCTQRE